MAGPSRLEKELIKVTKIKPDVYQRRNDFLTALAKLINDLSDEAYDKLSEAAFVWHKKAVSAINNRKNLPDFEAQVNAAAPAEAISEQADEPEAETEEADDEPDEDEPDEEAEDETEDKPEEKPEPASRSKSPKARGRASRGKSPKEEKRAEQVEPTSAMKRANKDNEPKKVKRAKASVEPEPEAEPEAPPKKKTPRDRTGKKVPQTEIEGFYKDREPGKKSHVRGKKPPTRYDQLDGSLDKYGFIKGTKKSDAMPDFEKGMSQSQCKERYGQTHYNALKRLVLEGHLVEKLPEGVMKLTHKDEIKKGK